MAECASPATRAARRARCRPVHLAGSGTACPAGITPPVFGSGVLPPVFRPLPRNSAGHVQVRSRPGPDVITRGEFTSAGFRPRGRIRLALHNSGNLNRNRMQTGVLAVSPAICRSYASGAGQGRRRAGQGRRRGRAGQAQAQGSLRRASRRRVARRSSRSRRARAPRSPARNCRWCSPRMGSQPPHGYPPRPAARWRPARPRP
jgi:hypothetical protein